MLKNLFKTLNNSKGMQKKFALLSVYFVCLTLILLSFGFAYPAGFAFVGCFVSLFAAAINASITSTSGAETSGDNTEAGSIR